MKIRNLAPDPNSSSLIQHLSLILIQPRHEQGITQIRTFPVRIPHRFVQPMRTEIQHRFLPKPLVTFHGLHDAQRHLPATGCTTRRQLEIPIGDLRRLPDGNGIIPQIVERHGAVLRLQRLDGCVGDCAGVERVGTVDGDGFEGIGVAFARHGIVEADAGAVGSEIDGPVGVRDQEIDLAFGGGVHLVD